MPSAQPLARQQNADLACIPRLPSARLPQNIRARAFSATRGCRVPVTCDVELSYIRAIVVPQRAREGLNSTPCLHRSSVCGTSCAASLSFSCACDMRCRTALYPSARRSPTCEGGVEFNPSHSFCYSPFRSPFPSARYLSMLCSAACTPTARQPLRATLVEDEQ